MAEDIIGKTLGGRYRIDSPIETDELADLYHGTDTVVDREITLKIVQPDLSDFKNEFFEEARKISRISHPNVLSVSDLGEDSGTLYVVYENFDGQSLKTTLRSQEQFPVDLSVSIVRQTAAALAAVFGDRRVHGLVGPSNILLTPEGDGRERVKAINFFGSSTFNRPNRNAVFVPGVEEVNYAAPELLQGNDADERSDVYSLGSILFRLLTGEIAFSASSMPEAATRIISDPPPPMSSFRNDLPDDLERVILTAMAKNPEMRYQTVTEFSNELARFVGDQDAAPSGRAPGHEIWKTAFVVLAGISILTVALIYATSVKQTDPSTRLQPDANGQPVQPINPATGIQEQSLANMQGMSTDTNYNSNMNVPPGTLPGGDGYDPWKNGVQPPPGAPKVGQGGQVVTTDPNNPSVFMPPEGCIPQPSGILLCPAPVNKAKPTPTPKPNAANANVQPSPTPKPEVKPTPTVQKTPVVKATPGKDPAAGKPKNSDDL